jgi:hypothetical protein
VNILHTTRSQCDSSNGRLRESQAFGIGGQLVLKCDHCDEPYAIDQ